MATIRFWRWQSTDEFGMPCPTRFPITDVKRKGVEPLEDELWSLEAWNLKRSPTEIARGSSGK